MNRFLAEEQTKKDFIATAAILKNHLSKIGDTPAGIEHHRDLTNAMADMHSKTNPQFDRAKYLKAAGVKD